MAASSSTIAIVNFSPIPRRFTASGLPYSPRRRRSGRSRRRSAARTTNVLHAPGDLGRAGESLYLALRVAVELQRIEAAATEVKECHVELSNVYGVIDTLS